MPGAVLVAKLSLGALALNDIWFGGQTMNPWLLEEGSSGSSAGPGAATAAGLVGFAIGSETRRQHRQSVDALRRHRAAAHLRARAADRRDDAVLVAGQTRSDDPHVEDAMLVLAAITGPDAGDVASVPSRLDFDAAAPRQRPARGIFSGVDEGGARHGRGPRGARDGGQAWG